MSPNKDISQLDWALTVYSDIVKFGINSNRIDESGLCLKILEEFEEYEKCYDVFLTLSQRSTGLLSKISSNQRKNGRGKRN
jgi:hypothetical protein